MKKKTLLLVLIGALLLLILIFLGIKYPSALYSHGDLVKAHDEIGCMDCHIPFRRVATESCSAADCHEGPKIGSKLAVQDLHKKTAESDCIVCHTDHKGADARITRDFSHTDSAKSYGCVDCHTGDGRKAHKDDRYGTDCQSCHRVREWKEVTFSHEKFEAKPCANCHEADLDGGRVHKKGDYGRDCRSCHTTEDWKKITFSHDRLSRKTACSSCHAAPKDRLHAGAVKDCDACHKTDTWETSTYEHIEYFPLTDDHEVRCSRCHDSKPVKYDRYTCMDCHEHATRRIVKKHREERIRGFYGDCLRCHQVRMGGRSYGTRKVDDSMVDDDDGYEDDD